MALRAAFSCLDVEIFTQRNSIVTKRCHLVLGEPLIIPHCTLFLERAAMKKNVKVNFSIIKE